MEPIKKSDIDRVFGKIFKEYRLKNRITQEDLSEKLGISPKYISRIENGNSGIKTQTLISYINLLGISPNVLYKDFIKNEDLKRKTLIFEKNAILMFIMSTFYYPIVEEIVFKKSFKDILKNKWLFIIVTGLINAVCNIILSINDPRDFIYLIPNAVFSMCFSYIYYETDNLIVPIIYRILYNLIPSLVAFVASMFVVYL